MGNIKLNKLTPLKKYLLHICSGFNFCRDCGGPAPAANETGFDKCWAVEDYKKYYTGGFRILHGAESMKKEIVAYGPISCGIHVTDQFEAYKGGIYEEEMLIPIQNHVISTPPNNTYIHLQFQLAYIIQNFYNPTKFIFYIP
jgi:hypothetical protein